MTRAQLEHLIRAAGEIAQDKELIVLGGQAVLAQFPQAPDRRLAHHRYIPVECIGTGGLGRGNKIALMPSTTRHQPSRHETTVNDDRDAWACRFRALPANSCRPGKNSRGFVFIRG